MALPTLEEVAAITRGRLKPDNPLAQLLLDEAIGAAQDDCGWHVTPIRELDEIVVDGPGIALLDLPTMRVTEWTSVAENGRALELSTLELSRLGQAYKPGRSCWTDRLGGIEVVISHGYDDAPAFNSAVLACVDRMFTCAGGNLIRKRIDDVEYQWAAAASVLDTSRLNKYRILARS